MCQTTTIENHAIPPYNKYAVNFPNESFAETQIRKRKISVLSAYFYTSLNSSLLFQIKSILCHINIFFLF